MAAKTSHPVVIEVDDKIYAVTILTPKPGKMEDLEKLVQEGFQQHQSISGCLLWHATKAINIENIAPDWIDDTPETDLVLYHEWINLEAMMESGKSDTAKKTRDLLLALIDKPPVLKVVNWEPPEPETAKRVHMSFLLTDGGDDIHSQLDLTGEPLMPNLAKVFSLKPPMGLLEYQDLTLQGVEIVHPDRQIVDAVIMPVAPHAAGIPGEYYHVAYTETINLLNHSAAVIPVAKADKSIDAFDENYQPLNAIDKLNWEAYDPEIYDGASIGIQLVARKFEEEEILAIAKMVHAAVQKKLQRGKV